MCVILAVYGDEHPSKDLLKACHLENHFGAGVAWIDGDKVRWRKELADDEAVSQLIARREIKAPYLIHFRIPSVGGDNRQLTHPFPITAGVECYKRGTAEKILMHNGTWHRWDDVIVQIAIQKGIDVPDGPWSDSRAMAWIVHHTGINVLDLLLKHNASRIATLDVAGIQTLGSWHQTPTNGVWASNDHWKREYDKIINPSAHTTVVAPPATVMGPSVANPTPTQHTVTTPTATISRDTLGNIVVTRPEQPIDPLNIDSWARLTDDTRRIIAAQVSSSRPICTTKECLVELCMDTQKSINGKDYCGKCKTAQAHTVMCHKIENWTRGIEAESHMSREIQELNERLDRAIAAQNNSIEDYIEGA
jgi:hypothetical protein